MVDRARFYGAADDDSVISVEIPVADVGALESRWPPRGLSQVGAPDSASSVHLAITADPVTGQALAWAAGRAAVGGWDRIESDLALFAAERLNGLVAIHAAVIAQNGRAMLVPGATGVGKSTLCIAAERAGATVVTDEYALVDTSTGLVTGWQRPVRVRKVGGGVERLLLNVDASPLQVALVALVAHDGDSSVNAWRRLSRAETVVGLMDNTVCARSRPDESLDAAVRLSETSLGVAGTRGEAYLAIVELLRMLSATAG